MEKLKVSGQVSSTNYLSFNGDNENLTFVGGNINFAPKLNLYAGIGNLWTYSEGKSKNKPAFELKLKYNIGKNFNAQARFRELGGAEQYRVTFGANCKIDKHQSIYTALHVTTKNADEWKTSTGGWVGYTYKFNNGVSASLELQQNIPLNKTAQDLGKTLSNFDDSNKMVNLILSVPIE